MKIFIYKNGMCDPSKNMGVARQFAKSEDLDAYLDMFCASMAPRATHNYRIFITNDDVEFNDMDHFVLMDDMYGLEQDIHKIEEVPVWARAVQCNQTIAAIDKKRSLAKAASDKHLKQLKEKDKENAAAT